MITTDVFHICLLKNKLGSDQVSQASLYKVTEKGKIQGKPIAIVGAWLQKKKNKGEKPR